MPASFKHQGLCKLFGERPECVPNLLRTLLGIDLPADVRLVPAPELIREREVPDHSADVVLANRRATDDRSLEAFVFEMQLRPDAYKRWSWPIHVTGLRARLSCPTTLVVVATTTDYGRPFVSSVRRDNLMATQFHPEKSQSVGLQMLANFAAM